MPEKRARGFAAMNAEQQRRIASMGGRAAHERGTAHEWNSHEAAEAGRKGGKAAHHRGAARVTTNSAEQNDRHGSLQVETNGSVGSRAAQASANGRQENPGQTAVASMSAVEPQWSEAAYENRGTPV